MVIQILGALQWVFSAQTFWAGVLRFVGTTLISAALQGNQDGPRLGDRKLQISRYGAAIPRIYGSRVRLAGNVVDKTDLIEVKHRTGGFGKRSKGSIPGGERFFGLGRKSYYTYDVTLAILVAEGDVPLDALKRIFANGKVIFDRDAPGNLGPLSSTTFSQTWNRTSKTHSVMESVTFYRGTDDQTADPLLVTEHAPDLVPGYIKSVYVVIGRLQLTDWGNQVPNIEFEMDPGKPSLAEIVEELASFADADVAAVDLAGIDVRGYIVATDGPVWGSIEPLAGAFSFDMVDAPGGFQAKRRGTGWVCIIPEGDLGAVTEGQKPQPTKEAKLSDPNNYPDEVTITYIDEERDLTSNTERATRNEGYSRNKINIEVPITFVGGDEPAQMAERELYTALAGAKTNKFKVPMRYRFLRNGDCIGLTIGGNIEPFRISRVTKSPALIIEGDLIHEDPVAYDPTRVGTPSEFPEQVVEVPGDSILMNIDMPLISTDDDDTGFYATVAGTGNGWRGADISRSTDGGATFEYVLTAAIEAVMAEANTTLAAGPTDVWDRLNSVVVTPIGDEPPVSADESNVLIRGDNLAWLGATDGHDGELIQFATVTAGPGAGQYTLSDLLRGRFGTEHLVGTHGAGERLVLFQNDTYGRMDFTASDWNIDRVYRAQSIFQDEADAVDTTFQNNGEGKMPLSPTNFNAVRNSSNSDILITWTRRTRYTPPAIGTGAVPLGEDVELYSIDIFTGATLLRTLTSSVPSVNYTTAMQIADGVTPGSARPAVVYQMSGIKGRGHPLSGTA